MGKSHFTSDIIGKGSVTVASMASVTATTVTVGGRLTVTGNVITTASNVSAAKLIGTTSASAPTVNASTKVKAGSYFQMGAHQYVFFGTAGSSTIALAEATAIDASVKGSVYFSACATKAACYFMVTDSSASLLKDVVA